MPALFGGIVAAPGQARCAGANLGGSKVAGSPRRFGVALGVDVVPTVVTGFGVEKDGVSGVSPMPTVRASVPM